MVRDFSQILTVAWKDTANGDRLRRVCWPHDLSLALSDVRQLVKQFARADIQRRCNVHHHH
jgi:hypothetical protein